MHKKNIFLFVLSGIICLFFLNCIIDKKNDNPSGLKGEIILVGIGGYKKVYGGNFPNYYCYFTITNNTDSPYVLSNNEESYFILYSNHGSSTDSLMYIFTNNIKVIGAYKRDTLLLSNAITQNRENINPYHFLNGKLKYTSGNDQPVEEFIKELSNEEKENIDNYDNLKFIKSLEILPSLKIIKELDGEILN